MSKDQTWAEQIRSELSAIEPILQSMGEITQPTEQDIEALKLIITLRENLENIKSNRSV